MNLFERFLIKCFTVFYPVKIYGKENIPQGSALFVSNHFRAIDCIYIARVYGKDIKFLAKKELFKNKLSSKILSKLGAIPIDRETPELSSMIKVIKYLKSGHKVCVFPEGTRNKTGTTELQEMKSGHIVFATSSSSPIVPIMLSGKGRLFKRVNIYIGKPLEFTEYYGKKLVKNELEQLNEIVRENMIKVQAFMSDIERKNGSNKGKK